MLGALSVLPRCNVTDPCCCAVCVGACERCALFFLLFLFNRPAWERRVYLCVFSCVFVSPPGAKMPEISFQKTRRYHGKYHSTRPGASLYTCKIVTPRGAFTRNITAFYRHLRHLTMIVRRLIESYHPHTYKKVTIIQGLQRVVPYFSTTRVPDGYHPGLLLPVRVRAGPVTCYRPGICTRVPGYLRVPDGTSSHHITKKPSELSQRKLSGSPTRTHISRGYEYGDGNRTGDA